MIHVRLGCPSDVTDQLIERLRQHDAVFDLVVHRAASERPSGDAVQFDVLAGAANAVVDELRALGIDRQGSIALDNVAVTISDQEARSGARLGRFQQFTPVWAEVEARIRAGATFPPSWFMLLAIASVIGGVGILTNSQILIVGAMVVGPEYGAMASMAFGLTERDWSAVRRGGGALLVGFSLAVAAATVLGLVVRATGLEPRAYDFGIRPVADLINDPNVYSVLVATLAAVVGVISLTEARTSTLIGVFVSVTTIPAAADLGLSIAFTDGHEAAGALAQLLLNITLLVVVGAIAFVAQRRAWKRLSAQGGRTAGG